MITINGAIGVCWILSFTAFIPTTKQACVIYVLPKVANSETVSRLESVPSNLAELLNRKTQEWLGETFQLKNVENVKEESK